MGSETTLIVVRVRLENTQGSQITIGQASAHFNLVSHMLEEIKLMSMLVFFAGWVGVVEHSI
jgi:hypothetical protein